MQKSLLPPLLWAGLLMTSYSVHAADAGFCEQIARDLIITPNEKEDPIDICKKDQPHWNTDKEAHIKWCAGVTEAEANKKLYNHNKLVNLCNDSYKMVMLDLNRLASLPLSANEDVKLANADDTIKDKLLSGTLQNPYAKLYPEITQAIKDKKLEACEFKGLKIDMDKSDVSEEWLVSLAKSCLPGRKTVHTWVVQKISDNYRVLFEGDDYTINIHYSENNGYKNISIKSHLATNEETDKRCGSINASWHFENGRYIPFQGEAEESGDCLPEYNLPDYLMGENSIDADPVEWEKQIKAEDEKRIALFAPYKKALQEYIPEWMKNIAELVPENKIPPSAVTLVDKTGSTTANDSSSATDNDAKPTGEASTSEEETEKDKSFMQNVKAFFGLD